MRTDAAPFETLAAASAAAACVIDQPLSLRRDCKNGKKISRCTAIHFMQEFSPHNKKRKGYIPRARPQVPFPSWLPVKWLVV